MSGERRKIAFYDGATTQYVSPSAPLPVTGGLTPLEVLSLGTHYETVAASQTDQVLGATGAIGDLLAGLLVIPTTTSPGAVSIKDGAGTSIPVFVGGASSVSGLIPFFVPLSIKASGAGWSVTTGANVSVIAVGDFV